MALAQTLSTWIFPRRLGDECGHHVNVSKSDRFRRVLLRVSSAKELDIVIPPRVLGIADEVIE
jgi:hypothetical protein